MLIIPDIPSSYRRTNNSIGETLYHLVLDLKPQKIVEFGVQYGFSSICMAQALEDLGEGHLYAYDDWSRHDSKEIAEKSIKDAHMGKYITLGTMDFFEWMKDPEEFDLLHVDIDNHGDKIKLVAETFPGKHIIFEGGIPQRDEVKSQFPPMVGCTEFIVLNDAFPGLSKLI